jgi:hypothetical protein|tara:strand:- start:197 stop:319 length:123 start_codon:yes stop_codon:yes gene_type:complete
MKTVRSTSERKTAIAPDIPKGRLIKKEAGCRRIVGDPTKP